MIPLISDMTIIVESLLNSVEEKYGVLRGLEL